MERIEFTDPVTGTSDFFYVIEETSLAGCGYLLVAEEETGDSDAYILKLVSEDASGEVTYEMVEDERELDALARVFGELLEDTVIE